MNLKKIVPDYSIRYFLLKQNTHKKTNPLQHIIFNETITGNKKLNWLHWKKWTKKNK